VYLHSFPQQEDQGQADGDDHEDDDQPDGVSGQCRIRRTVERLWLENSLHDHVWRIRCEIDSCRRKKRMRFRRVRDQGRVLRGRDHVRRHGRHNGWDR